MSEDLKKSALNLFKKAADVANETATNIKDEYDKSDAKKIIDEKLQDTKEYLDDKGISDKASEISSYTTDQLDKVSGSKILELVEERLEMQDSFNDVLASKLEEALTRIKVLEEKLK